MRHHIIEGALGACAAAAPGTSPAERLQLGEPPPGEAAIAEAAWTRTLRSRPGPFRDEDDDIPDSPVIAPAAPDEGGASGRMLRTPVWSERNIDNRIQIESVTWLMLPANFEQHQFKTVGTHHGRLPPYVLSIGPENEHTIKTFQ